jgi:hypothetical protein
VGLGHHPRQLAREERRRVEEIPREEKAMTPEQKMQAVETQVLAARGVDSYYVFDCPYCREKFVEGGRVCCETMLRAMFAVMQRIDSGELIDANNRIFDRVN